MSDISEFLTLGTALKCAHRSLNALCGIRELLIGRTPSAADVKHSIALLREVAWLLVAAQVYRTALERVESPGVRALAPQIATLAAANDLCIAIADDLRDLLATVYGANVEELNLLLPRGAKAISSPEA